MNIPKIKIALNRYWLLVLAGIVSLIVGGVVCAVWMSSPTNQLLGMVTLAAFIGGAWLLWRQFRHRHELGTGATVSIADIASGGNGKVDMKSANTLIIEAKLDEDLEVVIPQRVAFVNRNNPGGQPWKCRNNGQNYFVEIWDIAKHKFLPFLLPDQEYTDPAFMAKYLDQPAQTKFMQHRESLMKYIGPGLLVVANIGAIIGIVALMPTGGA